MKAIILSSLFLLLSFSAFGNDNLRDFLTKIEGTYQTSGRGGCINAFLYAEGRVDEVNIFLQGSSLIFENSQKELLEMINMTDTKLSKLRNGTFRLCEGCVKSGSSVNKLSLSLYKDKKVVFEREIEGIGGKLKEKCTLIKK